MGFYREESIEEVRDRIDIVDLVSAYVTLKKTGKNYVGLCPFHSEKTPSFTVNREKGIYHCFGCQAGGDAFSFLMEHEHLDFPEALEELARRAGVQLEEDESGPFRGKPKDHSKELAINLEAARYFYKVMGSETGSAAVAYLLGRNVEAQTRRAFKLGYAPDSWDALLKHFESQDVVPTDVEKAGLAIRHEEKGTYYSRFRGRLMFPIENVRGEIIGFGGRVIGTGEPKYLNSPESALFQKKDQLYGLSLGLAEIRRTSRVLLMEGYMDVIMSHQHGFTSAVASLGTALTAEQARLISRYAREVVIVYDNDSAGIKAAKKAVQAFGDRDVLVRVADLRDAKDPDEFINSHGRDAFEEVISAALPAYEYLIRMGKKQHDMRNIEEKVSLISELLPFLADMNNRVKQAEYVRMTARELDVSADSIVFELKKHEENRRVKLKREEDTDRKHRLQKQQSKTSAAETVIPGERQLAGICLREPSIYREIQSEIEGLVCRDPLVRQVFDRMRALTASEKPFTFHDVVAGLQDEEIRKQVIPLCLAEHSPADPGTARDWIVSLRRAELRHRIDELMEKIEFLEKEGKMDELLEIGKRLRTLQSELNRI